MSRLPFFVALAAVCGLLAQAAAAAGTGGFDVVEARGAAFPVRTFVISLPAGRELTADDVQVTENGSPVVDMTLAPASAAGKTTFGSVLVVDASESIAGKPLQAAMAAARAFAAQRNPSTRVAFMTFNGSTKVVLPLTTSRARIAAALSTLPPVAYGTHIYDAVAKAEKLLEAASIDSGSIVLLSDGADTGSAARLAAVTAVARDHHIRLFTVGLRDRYFEASTLQSVAAQGGGEYAVAQAGNDLTSLFHKIGARLASEYVLQYKSLAGPKLPVKVDVTISRLGAASTAYETPALPAKSVAPYTRSVGSRVWRSTVTMVILALLAGAVVALLAIGLLQPRRSGLPARMAEFVSVPRLQDRGQGAGRTTEAEAVEKGGAWARLGAMLEIADINLTPAALVTWTVVGTVVGFLFLFFATSSYWWPLFALLVPFAVREWVIRTLAQRRKRFAEQLPDALQVISSALRSGQSFAGALAVVVESASEPMKTELQSVVADEQLGIPLQDSLAVVAERMQSSDLEQVALVAELQREAGGNVAEVVDRVAETVRERFELRRLVQTLTVQGRMSRWIVSALPVAIILILQIINPHYLHPLLAPTAGKVVFGLAAAWAFAGSLVIKKIVNIKV
jgi:tight adherence protein B